MISKKIRAQSVVTSIGLLFSLLYENNLYFRGFLYIAKLKNGSQTNKERISKDVFFHLETPLANHCIANGPQIHTQDTDLGIVL